GMKICPLEPDSPGCSICNITFTGILSRCWRWPTTAKQEEQRIHEISHQPGSQHGDLHRQEQAAAASGMAKESGNDRGFEESVSHRSRADSVRSRGSQAASHAEQALPAGDDAGASACLQSDLHRLRSYPRI